MSMFSAGSGSRLVVASAVVWGLVACQTSPPVPPGPPAGQAGAELPAIPAGARELRVSTEDSLLQILVYRGGAMARLGHNHVIASHQLSGSVYLTGDLSQSRFDITIPVNELTVDEPAMREQAGTDFPPGVPQSARDGTRANLLSAAMLDGANYPLIRLRALNVVAVADTFEADIEITLRQQASRVRVPMAVRLADGTLTATGEFPLKQTDLGLTPFSAAMGALQVVDEMRVRFSLVAR